MPSEHRDRSPILNPKWDEVRASILASEQERSQRHADIFAERRKEAARQQRTTIQMRRMRKSGQHLDELPCYPPISAWERREILGEVQAIHILRPSQRVMAGAGR